ncbi:hypothetical protein STEG23_020183, partial [Scotinomys teguina]
MTNIICLLYVGWVTNYIASVYVRGQEPAPDKKLEEDKGDTLKIIERLDHLENVIKQHIQGDFQLITIEIPEAWKDISETLAKTGFEDWAKQRGTKEQETCLIPHLKLYHSPKCKQLFLWIKGKVFKEKKSQGFGEMLSGQEHLMLLQKTGVQFPAPTS